MSYIIGKINSAGGGATTVEAEHGFAGDHDGQRTVLVVVMEDAATITSIYEQGTTTDGGFTPLGTHTAQGVKLWLFAKVCGPAEVHRYDVNFTPAVAIHTARCILTDFTTIGDPISAYAFADSASGTSITLPSVQATDGDDIYTVVWNNPSGDQPRPQSPLSTSGNSVAGTVFEEAREVWQSSAATGTRQYAVVSGSHDGAIGVIMLVGGYVPVAGGWGVGMVRMGAN